MTEIARWKEPIVYEVSAIYYTEDDPDWLTPRKAWTEHTLSIEAFGIPDMKPDYYALFIIAAHHSSRSIRLRQPRFA